MIKRPAIKKEVAPLLIFLAVAFLTATVVAEESTLSTKEATSVDASSKDKALAAGNPIMGTVNSPMVNIRQKPGVDEKIIGKILDPGTTLNVMDQKGDWIKVSFKNGTGWIYREYIDIKKEKGAQEKQATVTEKTDVAAQTRSDETVDRKETIKAVENKTVKLSVQPENTQNLMEVYKLARENDPIFQGERYRHEASPETLKQAYSELLPSASAGAFFQHTRQEILNTDVAVYGSQLAKYESKGYNLTLTQPIFRYPSIARVLQAREEVKRSDFEFEAAGQDLILRVAEAYVTTLEAYENLEFTRAEEEALKLHFKLAKGRYDNGLVPITDFHDAKARLASTKARRVKAEDKLNDAFEALAELSGQRFDKIARLKYALTSKHQEDLPDGKKKDMVDYEHDSVTGSMPLVNPYPDDINNWIEAALKQNVRIQARQQAVRVARREIDRQKGAHWPTLAFVGKMYRDDEGGSLFGGDSDVEAKEAIVQCDVPFFQGGSVFSKTREARKLYKAAQQDLEKEIRAVKREAKAGFLGVKSAIENTKALMQSVVSNRIALEAKREGFKSGLFPSLVVLDAERDFHQAKLEYAKAQYEYIRNSLYLKKAVATLHEDDLAAINNWLE